MIKPEPKIAGSILESLISNVPCGIRVVSRDYTVIMVNDAFEKISGIDRVASLGKKCFDVFGSRLCHTDNCCLSRILNGETKIICEVGVMRRDGTVIPCKNTAVPLYSEDGEISGAIEILLDVSERIEAEKHEKESEDRYRTLIELGDRIGEAVVMLQDVDGRIGRYIFVSDQWAKITGYSKPELLQMTIFDLLAPGHRQAALERYKKRGSGTVMPDLFEVTIVNKNGKEVPLEITSASSVYMGESVHVAYIRDVTQRKNAEKLLKEANDLYLSTINHTGDIITRIDRDNRRTLANDAACEFYGKKREQLLGERIDKYIHPEDAVLMMEAVERMKREKKPLKGMLSRAVTPNGVRFVEYNWYPYFDDRGGFDGWQATGRDVTDRMHLEQQVKTIKSQVNALQETEKLRDELLCAITHELRLPLSVIKGYATTLLDPDVKWDEKQKRTFLEEINLNSDRLGRLIQDLLQMSFIDAGMLKPDLQRISCQDICDSAIHMVSKIAPNHNLLSNAGSELPDVAADKERIVEVISNLVENAVKFSQQGTNIEISADCIEGEVVFSVKDEGVGIPALLINRVFDRFFQARNASGSTKGGIGLGLPICRGIITAHGGRIWVESEEMKGSKFSFSLPVFDGKQAEEKIFQSGKLK